MGRHPCRGINDFWPPAKNHHGGLVAMTRSTYSTTLSQGTRCDHVGLPVFSFVRIQIFNIELLITLQSKRFEIIYFPAHTCFDLFYWKY